jgi:hypothetical protein
MQQVILIITPAYNCLYEVIRQVEETVTESGVQTGMVNVPGLREKVSDDIMNNAGKDLHRQQ